MPIKKIKNKRKHTKKRVRQNQNKSIPRSLKQKTTFLENISNLPILAPEGKEKKGN